MLSNPERSCRKQVWWTIEHLSTARDGKMNIVENTAKVYYAGDEALQQGNEQITRSVKILFSRPPQENLK